MLMLLYYMYMYILCTFHTLDIFKPTCPGARQSLREGTDAVEQAIQMKVDLLAHIDKIGDQLPPNTLDELIDSLGGTDAVAEVRTLLS